ncbi:MAG: hypothetical protein WC329_02015 [Candidatus Omnitrophota bacterium]|jgi:hypothetical protein
MAIDVVTKFLNTATVRAWVYVYDDDNALIDPTAVVITITDPAKVVKTNAVAMTKSDTGIYYYDYHAGVSAAAMDKGKWRGVATITDGSGATAIITPVPFSFEVE